CQRWAKDAYSVFRYSIGAISNLCNRNRCSYRRNNVKSPTGLVRSYSIYRLQRITHYKSSEWPALWALACHTSPFFRFNTGTSSVSPSTHPMNYEIEILELKARLATLEHRIAVLTDLNPLVLHRHSQAHFGKTRLVRCPSF